MKKRINFLILIVISSALFYVYTNSISVITEQNFKELSIQKADTIDEVAYELTEISKATLFASLLAISEPDIPAMSHSIDANGVHEYQMTLTNKWGFSRNYKILYAEDRTVYLQMLQGDKAYMLYKVEEPDFFYSHEGFSAIYSDRYAPIIEVAVNGDEIPFQELEKKWSYRQYGGQWISSSEREEIGSSEEDKGSISVVSKDERITLTTDKPPCRSYVIIRNRLTDEVMFSEVLEDGLLPYPSRNGQFDYELEMEWNKEVNPYQGRIVVKFSVTLDIPVEFELSKHHLIQGDILEISAFYVENIEDLYMEQSIFKDLRWYVQGDIIRGYIPTNYNTRPGIYEIRYGSRNAGTELIEEIEVLAHDYRIQYMYIDKAIEKETRNEEAYVEFAKYFTPVRNQSAPERYYTEPFMLPAKGRLTSEFGQTRYVNDEPTSSRHSGLDIAAPTGTEIIATNRGKVVLARALILTGNTIVIDHGQGLFSVYFHMHESIVGVGEIVERGQKIATIGTTGFSTGPHLHFTMSYYTMNIEPGFLLVGQPITFSNYRNFLE